MRKAAIMVAAFVLAMAAGAQALSNSLARQQPVIAAALSPYAAEAHEEAATALISADAQSGKIDVSGAEGHAARAAEAGLLSTEALAILALAQEDAYRREAIIDAAFAASRRGRVLNSAAMIAALEASDTDRLLTALNRTMLLYPSQREAMIPLMVQQLADKRMVPAFVQLLQTEPEWAEDFYIAAAREPDLAANIAQTRLSLPPGTTVAYEANRAILRALARAGQWDEAGALFARINDLDAVPPISGTLGWSDEYTPLEWEFFDRSGYFARRATDGDSITVMARGGNGGVIARRLVRLPETTTVFQVSHSLDMGSASRVRISLECPESNARWSDSLGPSPTMMRVDQALDCDYAWLRIMANAPAGAPVISGEILEITVM